MTGDVRLTKSEFGQLPLSLLMVTLYQVTFVLCPTTNLYVPVLGAPVSPKFHERQGSLTGLRSYTQSGTDFGCGRTSVIEVETDPRSGQVSIGLPFPSWTFGGEIETFRTFKGPKRKKVTLYPSYRRRLCNSPEFPTIREECSWSKNDS